MLHVGVLLRATTKDLEFKGISLTLDPPWIFLNRRISIIQKEVSYRFTNICTIVFHSSILLFKLQRMFKPTFFGN